MEDKDGHSEKVTMLQTHEAKRMLGEYLAEDGNTLTQAAVLRKKGRRMESSDQSRLSR